MPRENLKQHFITVGELIEQLKALDPTLPVVHQVDPEGNGYSPVYGVELGNFDFVEMESVHPEDGEDFPDAEPAVFIWPKW